MEKAFIKTESVVFNKGIISRRLAGIFCSMSWVYLGTFTGRPIKFVGQGIIKRVSNL